MRKTIKQYLPIGAIVLGSILLLSLLSYVGFKSEDVQQTTTDKTSKMKYVLVNEDKGTTFEGKNYSLGSDFVTLINQDSQNRWETTTRDIATRGIENGQFDAQIIIPQDFSERLLSLQSIKPEQALVEYRVREGQNEVTNQVIQTKVNDVLKDFNQRIVQMYFSSIVGNLAEAQQNVNLMVGVENTHRGTLEKNVYLPFKDLPTEFTSVIDTASILDEENKVFTSEQEAFVEAVKSLMETNNSGLEENSKSTEEVQKSVNDYADEANEKIDTSIKQFNEQFDLQKEQLETQWGNDLSNYKNQYDQFNTSITEQLGLFYTPGLNGEKDSGAYINFLDNANQFKESQSKRIEELKSEIGDLEEQVTQLENLRKNTSNKYFNKETLPEKEGVIDENDIDDQDVKDAISNLITPIEPKVSAIDSNYIQNIADGIEELKVSAFPTEEELNDLLEILESNGRIDSDTKTNILASYNIVTRYSNNSLVTGSDTLQILNTRGSSLAESLSSAVTNTISIPISTNYIKIRFIPSDPSILAVTNIALINTSVLSKVNNKLPGGYNAISTIDDDRQGISLEIIRDDSATEPFPSNLEIPVTFSSTLNMAADSLYSNPSSMLTQSYSWQVNGTVKDSGYLSLFFDTDQPLKNDLPVLFKLFDQLTSTAEKIALVYANPADVSIRNFSNYLSKPENVGKSFDDLITPTDESDYVSVYWLYNNITDDKAKNNYIPDSLVVTYKNNGIDLYNDITKQINDLKKVIGIEGEATNDESTTLYGTLHLMTTPEMLIEEADKLKVWYDQANDAINTTYNSWSEADKVVAESVITENNPHPEKNQTEGINAETDNLVKEIQSLASSSREVAQATGESAAKVKDISPDIQNLKESSKRVETNATDILNNLDKTVSDVQKTTKDNTDYAEKFNKVLANTKNGGSDNKTVFNFLSNPIQDKGEFGKTRQTSLIPYYATVIGAFVSLFVAISLQKIMKRRHVSKEDLMLNPSRAWYNIPNVTLAVIIITVLAITFGIDLSLTLYSTIKVTWFSYTFLTLFAGTLVILGCMRQFRVLTLYICGGILGLFFFLTPLIGVATKSGSLINLLFRFSPLQNIQNGFTALLNGGSVGWMSYLILVLLTIIGLSLNFWVKPEDSIPSST